MHLYTIYIHYNIVINIILVISIYKYIISLYFSIIKVRYSLCNVVDKMYKILDENYTGNVYTTHVSLKT